MIAENSLCCIIALPLLPGDPPSWNSIAYTDSLWVVDVLYRFLDKKVKGQGHNALITENNNWCIIPFPLTLSSWNCTHRLLYPFYFWVQRSSSQCIGYWKWFMSHNWFPFTPIIMKFAHRLPMSWGYATLIFGSKGLRLNVTQCIEYRYWKQFMLHDCSSFTPWWATIMKLHTQTPDELWMCFIDFWIKRLRSQEFLLKTVFVA